MSAYNGYIERLSKKVNARLADIEAVFNFDFGVEYEVAICQLLEDFLPSRFGVCRGFVVSEDGRKAGDDVIIYDRLLSPSLRALGGIQYAVKEQIPVDAVYAYIECKNSINEDDVMEKSIEQVRSVKKLLLERNALENKLYEKDGPIYLGKARDWPRPLPRLKNQPYCAIFARSSSAKIPESLARDAYTPDLMILGIDHIATQSVLLGPDGIKGALFYDDKYAATLRIENLNGNAFGVGLVSILQAISWIELVQIDWANSLNEAFYNALVGNRTK